MIASAIAFAFNVVIDTPENASVLLSDGMDALPALFACRAAHIEDGPLHDKSNSLFEQLARLQRTHCYVEPKCSAIRQPFSLLELSLRQVAALPRDVRLRVSADLMDELLEPLGQVLSLF